MRIKTTFVYVNGNVACKHNTEQTELKAQIKWIENFLNILNIIVIFNEYVDNF